MNAIEKQKVRHMIEDAVSDMVGYLEENRYEPSERGAGTAPSPSSIDDCCDVIVELIAGLSIYDLKDVSVFSVPTIAEVIEAIQKNQESNIANDLFCLKSLDFFKKFDQGCDKYKFIHTVYQYNNTDNHIMVIERRSNDEWETTTEITAYETVKKETIKYEWELTPPCYSIPSIKGK